MSLLDLARVHSEQGSVGTCLALLDLAGLAPTADHTSDSPQELLDVLRGAPLREQLDGNGIIALLPADVELSAEAKGLELIAQGNDWAWQVALLDGADGTPVAAFVDIDGESEQGIDRFGQVDLGDFLVSTVAASIHRLSPFTARTLHGIDRFESCQVAARPDPSPPSDFFRVAAGPGWFALGLVAMATIVTWDASASAEAARAEIGGPTSAWNLP